jgi:hypothetical protein
MLPNLNNCASQMFRHEVLSEPRRGRRLVRAIGCEESGQVLPLLLVIFIALLGAGVVVFMLGISSGIETTAQTAADAAALAGEQELVDELRITRFGPGGVVLPPTYDPTKVCQKAEHYADINHATMSCPGDIQFIAVSGLFGTDVEVTVHSQTSVPDGSGTTAVAKARASTDPYSQNSPPITTSFTCDASVVDGTPFNPPTDKGGNRPGFFAKAGTNYTQDCEAKLAGKLDALAKAEKLHLVGTLGYTGTVGGSGSPSTPGPGSGVAGAGGGLLPPSPTATPRSSGSGSTVPTASSSASNSPGQANEIEQAHECGTASTVDGLPKPGAANDLTAATLRSFGLSRPIPGAPNEIALEGHVNCKQTATSGPPPSSLSADPGNSDVHLVDLNGGPIGAFGLGLPGVIVQPSANALALGCTIYSVGLFYHVNSEIMLATFMAAWAESSMTNITTYTPNQAASLGLFQQQSPDGWGTVQQEINPVTATQMFIDGTGPGTPFYNGRDANPGAIQVYQTHPGITPWMLAQTVQHSAFSNGSNYAAQEGTAQNMINEIQAGACNKK